MIVKGVVIIGTLAQAGKHRIKDRSDQPRDEHRNNRPTVDMDESHIESRRGLFAPLAARICRAGLQLIVDSQRPAL